MQFLVCNLVIPHLVKLNDSISVCGSNYKIGFYTINTGGIKFIIDPTAQIMFLLQNAIVTCCGHADVIVL